MWETVRIIRDKNPKFVLWENVKNVLSQKHKHNFEKYIKTLEEYGYNSYYQVLDSKDYGIAQKRERIFVLSIRKDLDNGKFKFPDSFVLTKRLKDYLEKKVDSKYFLSDAMKQYIVNENEKWTGNNNKSLVNKSIASTINTREGGRRCDASNYIIPILNDEDVDLKAIRKFGLFDKDGKKHQAGSVWDIKGLSPTLDTMQGGWRQPLVILENEEWYKDIPIRRLTPKECWRLMGFDDKDVDICIENKLSNTQLYKMAGNSIVVDILFYIYLELYKAMPYLFDDLKVLSLFSGIGAFEKALDRLYDNIN